MTLSYRIIKRDNLKMSAEGVKVATQQQVKRDQAIKAELVESQLSVSRAEISPEEKEDILKNFRDSLEIEKNKILKDTMQAAEKKAEEMVAQVKNSAYENGYREGYEKGYKEAVEEGRLIRKDAMETLQNAQNEVDEYFEREKENIIRLAGQMAEKIINHEIETSSQTVIDMVAPVIQDFRNKGTVIITCSKIHMRKLKENIFSLKKLNGDIEFVIIDNPGLETNEVTLEYDNQIIDLNMKSQLESMIQQLIHMEA